VTSLLKEQAVRLAARLLAAFPDSGATQATAAIFAEKLVGLDASTAVAATERLIDTSRRFPTVVELFEAYAAAGGQLPDASRQMSPAVGPPRPRPTKAEAAEIAKLRATIRKVIAEALTIEYGPEPDDDQGGR